MSARFTNQARKALALANEAARSFGHEYVGTEHILLGLLEERSGGVPEVLATFGVDAGRVRSEIDRLVQRGTNPVSPGKLPQTPRVKRAIEFAMEQARIVNESCVSPEHLLLGLLQEENGVAAQVLLSLKLNPTKLRNELLKPRLAQMKIVERAVRPVRAGTLRKRKMREELLAHLSAIYDQENDRLHDPTAALDAALQRFGAPAELAAELQNALPAYERFNHFVERWLLYRAPESAAHFSWRMATYTFWLLVVILSLVAFGVFLGYGWVEGVETTVRVFAAIVLLWPPVQFAAWLVYIKMRDAMWGAFGSRKSLGRVLALDLLIGLLAAFFLFGVATVTRWDITATSTALPMCGIVGILAALAFLALARLSGPSEICDTHWALLDIETA
jgi:ATP-dependent Clp protease ATP-binding subunit ClpC